MLHALAILGATVLNHFLMRRYIAEMCRRPKLIMHDLTVMAMTVSEAPGGTCILHCSDGDVVFRESISRIVYVL